MTATGNMRAALPPSSPLQLSGLAGMMQQTAGRPDVVIGVIDGPIAIDHADLSGARIRPANAPTLDGNANEAARRHGTFVAGVLSATRNSVAPAICPQCTVVHAGIFGVRPVGDVWPSAEPRQLVEGLIACIDAGAEIVNMSVAASPSPNTDRDLDEALNYASDRRVVVVAAAGNDGTVGSTPITRHPGVVPVSACDAEGRPLPSSNLGHSIARRGLSAPGQAITSLDPDGGTATWSGSSVATPFVTGALALLRSLVPARSAVQALWALRSSTVPRRRSITPAVLNAQAALMLLSTRS